MYLQSLPLYTLLLATVSCLPSAATPAEPPLDTIANDNGQPFCRRTERVSRLACARAVVRVKSLPYFSREITWSEAVAPDHLGHLPWTSYAEDGHGRSCSVAMDAARGVHDTFSLQDEFREITRMYSSCVVQGNVAAYDRIGRGGDVQVKIGPYHDGWAEGVGFSANQQINATAAANAKRQQLEESDELAWLESQM